MRAEGEFSGGLEPAHVEVLRPIVEPTQDERYAHELRWHAAIHRQSAEVFELQARHARELIELIEADDHTAHREIRVRHYEMTETVAKQRGEVARDTERRCQAGEI